MAIYIKLFEVLFPVFFVVGIVNGGSSLILSLVFKRYNI